MKNRVESRGGLVSWIQEMAKEKEGRDISYEEAKEGADNLVGFFDLLLKIDRRNNAKHRRM